jgi:uncharacterized protein (DUF362 family)
MARKLERREFVKLSTAAAASVAVGLPRLSKAAGRPVLVQGTGPGVHKDLDKALKLLLEPLGGMGAFVKKGQKVMLKPNLGFPSPPGHHATTSPELIAAVARSVLAQGASTVWVADHTVRNPALVKSRTGLPEALSGLDVEIVLPDSARHFVPKDVPRGKELKKTHVLKTALDAGVHIALPVAKSHVSAGFTGTLKGMMGLVHDRGIFHGDLDLHQAIADLNTLLKPHLTIMDGIMVMTRGGPAGPGPLATTDSLIAGTDPVAVDAAGVRLAPLYGQRIDPGDVQHLAHAVSLGLGTLDPPAGQIKSISLPA